jgi:glucose/arabinose dehydrogenase
MKNILTTITIMLVLAIWAHTGIARQLPLDSISLPEGFQITVYADDVPNARSMALSPNGTLFVGTRKGGKVYAILDHDDDYVADQVLTLAKGLKMPNGVSLRDGDLYVAEVNRILRWPNIEDRLEKPGAPEVIYDRLPQDTSHGWKFIRFGPDGKLYVPVGAPCNICEVEAPYASILRMNPDGSDLETYASGIRNTVGFDWHPDTQELWFTENGRDWLGDNLPPDELNHAPTPGLFFGFPFYHGKGLKDPDFGKKAKGVDFTPPVQELGPHVASLGMRFYTGDMFPEEYRHQIFIAEHGSWNRSTPIGYRITLVRLNGNEAVSYEIFAEGWLRNGRPWGRPVDVQQLPDGSLLVSDDDAGAIYRIVYQPD